MLIPLTGVSGFLGRYTVTALRQKGHHIRALVLQAELHSQIESIVDELQAGDQYDPQAQSDKRIN